MDRDELLDREREAWPRFVNVIRAVPAERRDVEGVVPGWSTHDLVWHVAYWAGYASDVLERMQRGEPEPEVPEDWGPHDAEVLRVGRTMSWDEVIRQAERGRERARTALSALSDLSGEAVDWFTDDTFDHYEEHGAQILAFGA